MSPAREIEERWSLRVEPMGNVTERVSRESWDASATWWAGRYGVHGDVNREWVIDPALFRLLGDVRGRRILDAGSGTGYLSRHLADRGAKVAGVDHSAKLLAVARRPETLDPPGAEYSAGGLARLPQLDVEALDPSVPDLVLHDGARHHDPLREVQRRPRSAG